MKRSAILLIAILSANWPAAAAEHEDWKAGASKTIITPSGPIWMPGYIRDRPSEGTAEDLWAKALVLEDPAGRRVLLITMDLVGLDRTTSELICAQLGGKYGLERQQIALNCSHTHHGPAVGRNLNGIFSLDDAQRNRIDEYTRQLIDQLVALAGEAIGRLQPAVITYGQGYCTVAVNRRTNTRKDAEQVRESGQLRGPSDFDVPVLAVRDPQGKLQAIAFGYACHPTTLAVDYKFSGDYAGYAQAALEEAHAGAIALFWQGCGGDQAPRPKDTVELTQGYGRRLAAAVDEVLRGAQQPLAGPIATRYDEIPLRLARPPSRDALEKEKSSRNKFVARRAERELAQLDAGRPLRTTYPYPVQVWRLGDLRWVFLGGEVVVDYALRLKRELGPAMTWVAGYTNDVMAYIPSLRVLREGGYEPVNSVVYYDLPASWSEDVETQIVDQVERECQPLSTAAPASDKHDKRFTPLFNGRDLAGWHGMETFDIRRLTAMSAAERTQKLADGLADLQRHWTVVDGELVNDGRGTYATTDQEFGDIELLVDYRMLPGGDSGVYLRGTPQVQIWDYTPESKSWARGVGKGSGGLFNNDLDAPGRGPLVLADRPFGEWNHFRILQAGARTSVWLNDKLVVDHAIWQNYFARPTPALPFGHEYDPVRSEAHELGNRAAPLFARGPIQLQTHGSEIRWRNIMVREIAGDEANRILASHGEEGFTPLFNGRDLTGWSGAVGSYEAVDGTLACKPRQRGVLYTEQEYGDFIVRLEFKLSASANNGLAIRYPGSGGPAYVGMCELQILDDDHPKHARIDTRQFHGSVYAMIPAHRGYLRPLGQWNFQEVTVCGSSITAELNGSTILDTDLAQVTKFMKDEPHPGKDLRRGHFGFAGHGDPIWFRNVRIKPLN